MGSAILRRPDATLAMMRYLLFVFTSQILCTAASISTTIPQDQRHNVPPERKHAQILYPQSIESANMISPCKPERDGYFGSTSGIPTILQYGFEMESIISSTTDIADALEIIRERIMDVLLSYSFPTICMIGHDLSTSNSNSNNHNRTAFISKIDSVTGFHFEDDFDAVRTYLFLCVRNASFDIHFWELILYCFLLFFPYLH
jgi:hypothetical protein